MSAVVERMVKGRLFAGHLARRTAKTRVSDDESTQPDTLAEQMMSAFVCAASGMMISAMKLSMREIVSRSSLAVAKGARPATRPASSAVMSK